MIRKQKHTASLACTSYRHDGRIVLEGLTPNAPASVPSDLVLAVDAATGDQELGTQVLLVLDAYGKRPRGDHDALLQALGVSSWADATRSATSVSVELRHSPSEVVLAALRAHPTGGWVGDIFDPVFRCPSANVVAIGTLLRKAHDLADGLPPGR